MKKVALLATILMLPMSAFATNLFYCKTEQGKQISIQQHHDVISYTYGKDLANPEITLHKPKKSVQIVRDNYDGDSKSMIINIFNKQYTYSATVVDFGKAYSDDGKSRYVSGGLFVLKNNDIIATLDCVTPSLQYKLD